MAFTWISFIIQALLSSFLLQYVEVGSLSILVIMVTTLFLLMDLSRFDFPKQIFVLLVAGYLFRLFFLFIDLYGQDIFQLPHSGFDTELFQQSTLRGLQTGNYGNGSSYSMLVGFIYTLFGTERLTAQYFNVLLSVHAIVFIYKTMGLYRLTDKTKYIVLAVMSFIPNYAIMSSILLRESLIIFLSVMSFYYFSKWLTEQKETMLILAYGFGLLMSVFHSGSIFLIGAYTIFLILYDNKKNKFNINARSIFVVILFIIAFNFISENYSDLFLEKFNRLEDITDVTNVYVMGESGYAVGYEIGNPIINFLVNTPLRIFYFVLSPLPWDWRGQTDIMAFVFSGLFYGGTLYYGFKHVFINRSQSKKNIVMLLIIISFGLIVFAWGVSNAGTALRHRDKFIGLFILLLAFLLENRTYQKENILSETVKAAGE